MQKRHLIAALTAAGTLLGLGSVAQAGEWRLDPWRCPDLREDIRDARVDYGRADRREDRRDRRVTNCPASAWVYVPSRYERRHGYYDDDYWYGPPRNASIRFAGGGYYGVIGRNRYQISLYDHNRHHRFARRYHARDHYDRHGRHYDRQHNRRDRYADRRDDRRDRNQDWRDDRRNDRGDRRQDDRRGR